VSPSGARIDYVYDAAGNITGMTVTPNSNAVPVLTSETTLFGEVGVNFSETLVSNKATTVFAEENLPSGLTLTRVSGLISGIPTTAGVFPVNVILRDSGQASNITVTIHVRPATAIAWARFAGSYTGTVLAETPAASAGAAAVSVTKTGTFSATLYFKGQRIPVSGTFSPTGAFSQTISGPNGSSLQVNLNVSRIDESVTGTISDGTTVAEIDTNRARANGEAATWQVGSYTFILRPDVNSPTAVPKGAGFGNIAVTKTGAGTFVGSLPDGAKVSAKLVLGKQNEATFFQGLYSGKGFLAGSLSLDQAPLVSGDLHWSHPAQPAAIFKDAFEADLSMEGSRFASRPLGTRIVNFANDSNNARLSVGQGSLTAPFTKVFTLDVMNKGVFALPNDEKLTFTISNTGLLSGSFLDATSSKTVTFNGVVLQQQNLGAGFILSVPASGLVELRPSP
jgi:hypothetical protein